MLCLAASFMCLPRMSRHMEVAEGHPTPLIEKVHELKISSLRSNLRISFPHLTVAIQTRKALYRIIRIFDMKGQLPELPTRDSKMQGDLFCWIF